MEPETTEPLLWRLQARFPDTMESAAFPSRQEAVEHAQALIRDYDGIVNLVLAGPEGRTEILHEASFMAQDGKPKETLF